MHMGHAAFMPPLINARCEAISPPERLFDSVTKILSAWRDIHFSSPVSISMSGSMMSSQALAD